MKTIGETITKGTRILSDAGIENARSESRILMAEYRKQDMASLYMDLDKELDDFTAMRFMKSIKKRATHYPFQYILGYTYFLDNKFLCRENVLIPRYDTEILVLRALEMSPARNIRVLDLCTGSGCVGISYNLCRKKEGFDDTVILSDISDAALGLAADNAKKLGADVKILKSDLFEVFEDIKDGKEEPFDMILSNPPYIRTKDINNLMKDIRDYEPRLALDGSYDGLEFYRRIIYGAEDYLTEDGRLALEIGCEQYMDTYDMMREAGYKDIIKNLDVSGLDRVISGML